MKYYIAENGQPAGPFELKELLEHGLTVNSQVWNESMDNWTTASQVPEVMQLLQAPTGVGTQQQYSPPAGYGVSQSPQPQQPQQPQAQPYQPAQQQYQQTAQPQYSQPQYGEQQYYGQQQYAQPQYERPRGIMPNDWKVPNMIVTILSVLCCCNPISMITGIIGWVKAGNVRTLYNHGDQLAAEEAANSAKTWFIISLVLMIVLSFVCVFYVWNDAELSKAFMDGYNNGYHPK